MNIVLVIVRVRQELLEEFERALLRNAQASVEQEAGCLRFDVSQDYEDPARWVLHEVYDAPASHALHRESAHFLAYDAVAQRAVTEKIVIRAAGRYVA